MVKTENKFKYIYNLQLDIFIIYFQRCISHREFEIFK